MIVQIPYLPQTDADDDMTPRIAISLSPADDTPNIHLYSMEPKQARGVVCRRLLDESDKHDKLDVLLGMSRPVITKIHGSIGRHGR